MWFCQVPSCAQMTYFWVHLHRGKGREMEDVRCLAAEHFNQGVSNPAWPTLSSIIDVCQYQTDESLSRSSDLGILSPTRPMTLICINHRRLFFTQSNINSSTCKAMCAWKPMVLTHAWRTFTFHFNLQDFSKMKRNGLPTIYWSCSRRRGPPFVMTHLCKTNQTFTNCAAIFNGEDVKAVGTTEWNKKGCRSHRVVFADCLWVLWQRKSGESWGNWWIPMAFRRICTHTNRPHVSSHLCRGFLCSPLLSASPVSSSSLLWLIPKRRVRLYLTARASRAYGGLTQICGTKIKLDVNTQADRGKQAPCLPTGSSHGLVACSRRLLRDHCNPGSARSEQGISAQSYT